MPADATELPESLESQGSVPVLTRLQEYLKQVTSLSTWSILLSLGLVERVSTPVTDKNLFFFAVSFFLVVILIALALQLWVVMPMGNWWRQYAGFLAIACLAAFLGGLACLARFTWLNL